MKLRDLVAFAVYCGDWGVDPQCEIDTPESVSDHFQRWIKSWMPELTKEHHPTIHAHSLPCNRCFIDEWYATADAILTEIRKAEDAETLERCAEANTGKDGG